MHSILPAKASQILFPAGSGLSVIHLLGFPRVTFHKALSHGALQTLGLRDRLASQMPKSHLWQSDTNVSVAMMLVSLRPIHQNTLPIRAGATYCPQFTRFTRSYKIDHHRIRGPALLVHPLFFLK